MSNNNDNGDRTQEITEQPTGEYPALSEADLDPAAAAEVNGTPLHLQGAPVEAPVKAAYWLTHLESEVTRIHAKWQSIEAEFKSREARIARLQEEIEARETTIAQLKAEVQRETDALAAAGERLAGKDGEIAALVDDRRARDERIAALSTELADNELAHKATLEKIAQAEAEAARLNDVVRQEQAAAASAAERNAQLLAEHELLQSKLQDLEIYINGRRDRWSELNSKLEDYENTLIGAEKTIDARNAVIARHDEEKQRLAARINELERQCAELAGRRKEREEAYDDLQKILAANIELSEHLKSESAARAKETEQAARKVLETEQHFESLERDIRERNESIDALKAEIEQRKAAVDELAAARDALATRVEVLEKEVAEGTQQAQVLRDDLRMSHDQLRLAQEQLSERTTQLASNQQALDLKSRHVERLTDDLHSAQQDAARTRTELETLSAHALELGRLRGEAAAEIEQLKSALSAREELVAKLESELRAKQATADLLERSVGRITDLGASLAALDEQMKGGVGAQAQQGAAPAAPQHSDFVATVAADDRVAAAAPQPAADAGALELLSMDLVLGDSTNGHVVDVGEPTKNDASRKLVFTIGGEAFDYPIRKKHMTIGRSRTSDIRIPSHFVSRVHAKISTSGVATIIEDAGSKNGILVNSERVMRRVLRDGDVVSLGGYDLNLRFVDATP